MTVTALNNVFSEYGYGSFIIPQHIRTTSSSSSATAFSSMSSAPSTSSGRSMGQHGLSQHQRSPSLVIQQDTTHHSVDDGTEGFSSYSALSPTVRSRPQELSLDGAMAAGRSRTPPRPRPTSLIIPKSNMIPISISSPHLPIRPELPNPAQARAQVSSPISPENLKSTISTLFGTFKQATWKRQQKKRMEKVEKHHWSNGTANYFFPVEEQEWDPKEIKRLKAEFDKAKAKKAEQGLI